VCVKSSNDFSAPYSSAIGVPAFNSCAHLLLLAPTPPLLPAGSRTGVYDLLISFCKSTISYAYSLIHMPGEQALTIASDSVVVNTGKVALMLCTT
jgi:hypothetical protein